jgi:hypothetical protein
MSAFKNFGRDSSLGESPSGKAPDFDSGIRRFDPYLPSHTRDGRAARRAPPDRIASGD